MRTILLFALTVLLIMAQSADAQKRKERKTAFNSSYNYEIQIMVVGMDGTKVYKVWGYGKKVEDAVLNAKRSAVAAAIFKDIPGRSGVEGSPALCAESGSAEKHADYFDKFFDYGGAWQNYVNLTNDAAPAGKDRLKTKDGYKVGVIVQVLYDNLRKDLEAAGITKALNSGF